jgi:hypothetical protein
MRRYQQSPPRVFFRGNELMRLLTMVGMLGVLLLLIVRSADPHTWSWLVNDNGVVNQYETTTSAGDTNNNENKSGSSETNVSSQADISNAKLPITNEVADEDPEEADAAKEQFQAVLDGTEKLEIQEMFAYRRVLSWVQNQTFAEMNRRASKEAILNRFYQTPDKYRGQLFKFDLTANLIRNLDEKYNGVDLYDVWGTTGESGQWFYNCVVEDIPKEMPVGRNVYEKVTFVGYFFKLQGYQPAGAKPNAAPLKAPLFVGRLIWYRDATPPPRQMDWSWGLLLLAGFLIILIIRWGLLLWGSRRRLFAPSIAPEKSADNPVDDWLANVQTDEPAEGDQPTNNP